MNRKGQDGEIIFGLILAFMFFILTLYGFFSENICNRLLIVVGLTSLVWLFFGTPLITRVEHSSGWKFFIPLPIVVLLIWIILQLTGICSAATGLWQALSELWM